MQIILLTIFGRKNEIIPLITFIIYFTTLNVSFVEVGFRTQITSKLWRRVFTITNLFDFTVNFAFAVINTYWFPVTPSSMNYISIIIKSNKYQKIIKSKINILFVILSFCSLTWKILGKLTWFPSWSLATLCSID